jgi:hypothetical protein
VQIKKQIKTNQMKSRWKILYKSKVNTDRNHPTSGNYIANYGKLHSLTKYNILTLSLKCNISHNSQ